MSEWTKKVGAMTLFVEDVKRAKEFYQSVFAMPLAFEDGDSVAFRFDNTIINLLESSAAGELIEPRAVATPDPGSRFQLTIWVDDADAVCAELASKGVGLLNGPTNRDWGQRTASFSDPDGNVWEIAQEISNREVWQ